MPQIRRPRSGNEELDSLANECQTLSDQGPSSSTSLTNPQPPPIRASDTTATSISMDYGNQPVLSSRYSTRCVRGLCNELPTYSGVLPSPFNPTMTFIPGSAQVMTCSPKNLSLAGSPNQTKASISGSTPLVTYNTLLPSHQADPNPLTASIPISRSRTYCSICARDFKTFSDYNKHRRDKHTCEAHAALSMRTESLPERLSTKKI